MIVISQKNIYIDKYIVGILGEPISVFVYFYIYIYKYVFTVFVFTQFWRDHMISMAYFAVEYVWELIVLCVNLFR